MNKLLVLFSLVFVTLLPAQSIDALLKGEITRKNKFFIFSGDSYSRYDSKKDKIDAGYPRKSLPRYWPGLTIRKIDAAINESQYGYLIDGNRYYRYNWSRQRIDQQGAISEKWPGLWWNKIDAAFHTGSGEAYFFKGSEVLRYNTQQRFPYQTIPMALVFPGLRLTKVDAATFSEGNAFLVSGDTMYLYNVAQKRLVGSTKLGIVPAPEKPLGRSLLLGQVTRENKFYLFVDKSYYRYDIQRKKLDSGYPRTPLQRYWPGLPVATVDASVSLPDGNAYLITQGNVYTYNWAKQQVVGPPRNISQVWTGVWGEIDAVFYGGDDLLYFIQSNRCIIYNLKTRRVSGSSSLADCFPGLPATKIDGATCVQGHVFFASGSQMYVYSNLLKMLITEFPLQTK